MMAGIKRSLLVAGLFSSTSQTSGYLFPVPTRQSSLSTTSTGQAIAARQAEQNAHQYPSSPSPRTASAGVVMEEPLRRSPAPDAVSNFVWPSVTRSPRPAGVVEEKDGPREGGRRERDDGRSPDFEVNLGRVISTLREDYPRILFEQPSFDIFTEEIELRDPTGVAFRGITNYKRVFATLRFFRQTFVNDASTTFRLTYDWSKQQVRVTWNVVLQLKARQRPFYVDAISAYHINKDGVAYRHDLETVVVNGTPVEPPFAYAWINLPAWVSRGVAAKPATLPIPHGAVGPVRFEAQQTALELDTDAAAVLRAAQTDPTLRSDFMETLGVLMATDGADGLVDGGGEVAGDEAASGGGGSGGGLVEEREATANKKVRAIKGKKNRWFGCDTSFDCTGGMVCCDFGLIKVCCSNGLRQPKFGDLVPSLIPIPGSGRNENDPPVNRPQPRRRTSVDW